MSEWLKEIGFDPIGFLTYASSNLARSGMGLLLRARLLVRGKKVANEPQMLREQLNTSRIF